MHRYEGYLPHNLCRGNGFDATTFTELVSLPPAFKSFNLQLNVHLRAGEVNCHTALEDPVNGFSRLIFSTTPDPARANGHRQEELRRRHEEGMTEALALIAHLGIQDDTWRTVKLNKTLSYRPIWTGPI